MRTMLRAENQYIFVAIDFKHTGSSRLEFSFAVFLRIAIAIDPLSMRCPAATVPSECLLLWNARLPLLPSEIPLAISKAVAMRTRALLAVPLQEMTIPA